jgi:hypothetical protein
VGEAGRGAQPGRRERGTQCSGGAVQRTRTHDRVRGGGEDMAGKGTGFQK